VSLEGRDIDSYRGIASAGAGERGREGERRRGDRERKRKTG